MSEKGLTFWSHHAVLRLVLLQRIGVPRVEVGQGQPIDTQGRAPHGLGAFGCTHFDEQLFFGHLDVGRPLGLVPVGSVSLAGPTVEGAAQTFHGQHFSAGRVVPAIFIARADVFSVVDQREGGLGWRRAAVHFGTLRRDHIQWVSAGCNNRDQRRECSET